VKSTPSNTPKPGDAELENHINSYELAWRMQGSTASGVRNRGRISGDPLPLWHGQDATDNFGRQCLLARRLCESGVRFVQVNYGDNTNNPAWDQHSDLKKHGTRARAISIDPWPDSWQTWNSADFSTPSSGGAVNSDALPMPKKTARGAITTPAGFSLWLAGGGFKSGTAYGETDEWGHHAVVDKVHMHDLHAPPPSRIGSRSRSVDLPLCGA
jgi:hypothetical protein